MAELPRTFGSYVLLKALGSGGAADVFLARPADPRSPLPTPLVIKRLHGEVARKDDLFRRFTHEARLTAALASPHLPRLFDVGRVGDTAFIAMEYLTGWTIARLIHDLQNAGKQASITSAVDLVSGGLEALSALHGARDRDTGEALHVVHRDVAPKNLMLGEDGVTRLIDFGLGKSRIQEWKTETGVVLGTPGYMSPEQVRAEEVDHRTDLYSIGIVLWELLTLKTYIRRGPVPLMLRAQASPTFTPAAELRADVPRALDDVLRVALAANRDDRFPSARHFLEALRKAVPRDEELDPLPTLVGAMLWGELAQEKTQVTELLRRGPSGQLEAISTPLEPSAAPLETAEPTALPMAQPLAGAPHDPAMQGAPMMPGMMPQHPQLTPGPQQLYTPVSFARPPEPKSVPLRTVVAMLVATLAIGLSAGAVLLGGRSAPRDVEVTPLAEPATRAAEPVAKRPTIAPLPTAVPAANEEPAASDHPGSDRPAGEPGTTEPATAKVVDAAAKAAPRRATTADQKATDVKHAEPTLEERTEKLLARAKALRSRLDASSPAAARATSLMSKLLMEASSPNTEGQSARLGQLEAELGRLELEEH